MPLRRRFDHIFNSSAMKSYIIPLLTIATLSLATLPRAIADSIQLRRQPATAVKILLDYRFDGFVQFAFAPMLRSEAKKSPVFNFYVTDSSVKWRLSNGRCIAAKCSDIRRGNKVLLSGYFSPSFAFATEVLIVTAEKKQRSPSYFRSADKRSYFLKSADTAPKLHLQM